MDLGDRSLHPTFKNMSMAAAWGCGGKNDSYFAATIGGLNRKG